MNVLVFNCGSSSQSFKVFRVQPGESPVVCAAGKARNVATRTQAEAEITWQVGAQAGAKSIELPTHRRAAEAHLAILADNGVRVDAVGHRFVHGGEHFDQAVKIDAATLPTLRQCLPLAPIHNPNSFSVIEVVARVLPGVPQYAVFDTAFHAQMPAAARRYALPQALAAQHSFHKVGFHGLSLQFVTARTAELLGRPLQELRLIVCHLGTGGASVTAVQGGQTVDTSMGYSPLAGLVMSTRCGDLDPQIVLELVR
ncbi:MAG TPA: acetate kinase, partial [Anaerolineaceae bacterium]|nr:acetate kinase [Anaerolineaceae bacterium]